MGWIRAAVPTIALVSTWIKMFRDGRKAAHVEIAAKAAEARAEEALALAQQALQSIEGLHQIEQGRDRLAVLEAEADGRIRAWITTGRSRELRSMGRLPSRDARHNAKTLRCAVEIKSEGDLVAARRAAAHPEIRQVEPPVPEIGKPFAIWIDNPRYNPRR